MDSHTNLSRQMIIADMNGKERYSGATFFSDANDLFICVA
jgi:hypothetical protein